jgi:hypothetical protein
MGSCVSGQVQRLIQSHCQSVVWTEIRSFVQTSIASGQSEFWHLLASFSYTLVVKRGRN